MALSVRGNQHVLCLVPTARPLPDQPAARTRPNCTCLALGVNTSRSFYLVLFSLQLLIFNFFLFIILLHGSKQDSDLNISGVTNQQISNYASLIALGNQAAGGANTVSNEIFY